MTYYLNGWKAMPDTMLPINHSFKTSVSVLIPARNEADNIMDCINSILSQGFPHELLEIIVIDDFSTDNTASLVQSFDNKVVTLVSLADHVNEQEVRSFKKKALEIAVNQSKGDLIITTDADCIAGETWLTTLVAYYETTGKKFIAAPVNFYQDNSLFEKFQALDFHGMMVITGGGIHSRLMNMCNGANMAYERVAFDEVGGYTGKNNYASGDDMALIQSIAAKYPEGIGFIKNATACTFTAPKSTIKGFFNQRVRWTTKASGYEEWKMTAILGLVWLFCLSIPVTLIMAFFFGKFMLLLALGQLLIKALADYRLLKEASIFFNRFDLMKIFIPASFMHLTYIVTVGFWGNIVSNYDWKDRKVQ